VRRGGNGLKQVLTCEEGQKGQAQDGGKKKRTGFNRTQRSGGILLVPRLQGRKPEVDGEGKGEGFGWERHP